MFSMRFMSACSSFLFVAGVQVFQFLSFAVKFYLQLNAVQYIISWCIKGWHQTDAPPP